MIERFEVDPTGNPQAWHALRAHDVTASVAGCLFGIHPFQTAFGLWLLKSGRLDDDVEESPPMRRGRLLEPVAVELLREQRPNWHIERSRHYYRDPAARLGATPDVLATNEAGEPGVVQIKSVEAWQFRRKWKGDDGVITPPLWIAVQAAVEAYLTGAKWAAVAALTIGHGANLHIVDIPLTEGLIDRVKQLTSEFWIAVESGEAPPIDYGRDGVAVSRMYAKTIEESIDLSNDNRIAEVLFRRMNAHDAMTLLKDEIAACDAEVKAKLGHHAVGIVPGWTLTWKAQTRKAYTVPEATFRRLHIHRINEA